MSTRSLPSHLTFPQAARLIGVSTQAVHKAVEDSRLRAITYLETRMVRRADAQAWRRARDRELDRIDRILAKPITGRTFEFAPAEDPQ